MRRLPRWFDTGCPCSLRLFLLLLTVGLLGAGLGCGRSQRSRPPVSANGSAQPVGEYQIDLFRAEPRFGTAVVLLVDTSGSMRQQVKDADGRMRPKNEIARESLEHIIRTTAAWMKTHPESNIQMGIYNFSSNVNEILPMAEFNEKRAQEALQRLPEPNSGTAIGRGLEAGFKALYRSGCARKFLVCVTDGENTSGPPPDWIASHLFARTNGEVEIHFVAFDTSARRFGFLQNVNGQVVEASDGAKLQAELSRIYEDRILVEKE